MSDPINYIRLDAGYDRNGNSRRVCIILDAEGHVVDVLNEESIGEIVVRMKYPALAKVVGPKFTTTPAMYREILRDWKTRKCWS